MHVRAQRHSPHTPPPQRRHSHPQIQILLIQLPHFDLLSFNLFLFPLGQPAGALLVALLHVPDEVVARVLAGRARGTLPNSSAGTSHSCSASSIDVVEWQALRLRDQLDPLDGAPDLADEMPASHTPTSITASTSSKKTSSMRLL